MRIMTIKADIRSEIENLEKLIGPQQAYPITRHLLTASEAMESARREMAEYDRRQLAKS